METSKGIEQAEVMRRWHEQQALPKSERDILEWRDKRSTDWSISLVPTWNFQHCEFRLRKRPRQKTVTVYLHKSRLTNTFVLSFAPIEHCEPLGQADITYEEPDDDAR